MKSEYESVPNPMANLPPSPSPHSLSALLSTDAGDDGGHEAKRAKGEGIRWSAHSYGDVAVDGSSDNAGSGYTTANNYTASVGSSVSYIPTSHIHANANNNNHMNSNNYSSMNNEAMPMPSKPSSSSLTSSHPSYTSFGSNEDSCTPDSLMWGQHHHQQQYSQGQHGQQPSSSQGQYSQYSQGQQGTTQSYTTHPTIHNNTTINSNTNNNEQPTTTTNRRIKRLERNRESARLSRKRRKAYLEELEHKVNVLGGEVDRERIRVVLRFLGEVRWGLGGVAVGGSSGNSVVGGVNNNSGVNNDSGVSSSGGITTKGGIKHSLLPNPSIQTTLSSSPSATTTTSTTTTKIPTTLQIIYTFQTAHLTSLTINMEHVFILWLLLQKEQFWRGGRGNSERLSAARIGERLLTNGTYKASPNGGMWPLLCHEIGLSYEQEDRVRTTQRAILADSKTWIHRHTAAATRNVLDSIQTTISQQHEAAKTRKQSILNVLTPEQRSKFMTWASQKSEAIRKATQSKLAELNEAEEYELNPQRHVAANMYIIDHRLSKIKSQYPPAPTFVHPSKLKKLGRRPCFESLAGQDAIENNTKSTRSNKLNRESSFPSTGSLKRTLNELSSCDDGQPTTTSNAHSGITVESAHAAAQPAVKAVFEDIMPIIPQAYLHQMNLEHFRPVPEQDAAPAPSTTTEPQALYAQSRVTSSIPRQPQFVAPPTTSSDDIDIPMPTPVSVLVQTHDEFLDVDTAPGGVPLEVTSAMQPPEPLTVESGFIPSIEYAPDPISSSQSRFAMRSYQSAPQLYTGDDFYPALMPTVPEESFHKTNVEEDDFADLEELGDPNDWAIGESFDMGMDGSRSPS